MGGVKKSVTFPVNERFAIEKCPIKKKKHITQLDQVKKKKISQVNPVQMHNNKSSKQLRPEMDLPSQHEAGGK